MSFPLGRTVNTWYTVLSAHLNILATKVPPGLRTWVVMFSAASSSCAYTLTSVLSTDMMHFHK